MKPIQTLLMPDMGKIKQLIAILWGKTPFEKMVVIKTPCHGTQMTPATKCFLIIVDRYSFKLCFVLCPSGPSSPSPLVKYDLFGVREGDGVRIGLCKLSDNCSRLSPAFTPTRPDDLNSLINWEESLNFKFQRFELSS